MRKALLVGVQRYTGGYSDSIGEAVAADLDLMRAVLVQINVVVDKVVGGGENEMVTSSAIKVAVAQFLTTASADDDLIVYFSGHGKQYGDISYLVPSDANPYLPDPGSYLVPVRFEAELALCPARSVTFVVDACRNGDYVPHARPAEVPATVSQIFATEKFGTAGIGNSGGPASVFTRAVAGVVPTLNAEVRLDRARLRIQKRLDEICQLEGIAAQQIDVVSSIDEDRAPFPLFQASVTSATPEKWSRLLRSLFPDLISPYTGESVIDQRHFTELLARADRLEDEASRAGIADARMDARSEWTEPNLPSRLTKALLITVPGLGDSDFERMLLVGIVVAVESAFRTAEYEILGEGCSCQSVDILLASDPSLRRLAESDGPEAASLRQWIAHLAATRETVLGRFGALKAKLSETFQPFMPDAGVPEFKRAVDYAFSCIRLAFDTGTSWEDVKEVDEADGNIVHGYRIAALVRMTWLLSFDTRLFPLQTGMHLLAEKTADAGKTPIAESLDLLQHARWKRVDSLLDLDFWNRSAALDFGLRSIIEEINQDLLRHRQQVGGSLHGTTIPLAVAASRLVPEPHTFRLPHVMFEVSAAETQSLLMGTNLYHDSALAIRELFQNAVDACRYRDIRARTIGGPHYDDNWKPLVTFHRGRDGGREYIECRDNGIGMSTHELREAFAKVGRRFRDLPEYVEEVADWKQRGIAPFEPISQFGIGVLSYFMLADQIEVRTARVDRMLTVKKPLRVEINGGHSLFRIIDSALPDPIGGGTAVRLYLRPDKENIDLDAVLARIIRCPTVEVRYGKTRWSPGTLYHSDGKEAEVLLPAPELGVYLHHGVGEILINGIPTEGRDPITLLGCTISVGGWANPDLSIDRRSLLSIDRHALSERLRAAAQGADQSFALDVNWLIDFYYNDIRAADLIYAKFKNTALRINAYRDDQDGQDQPPKTLMIEPAVHGIYAGDPTLIKYHGTTSTLGQARISQLFQGADPLTALAGFPKFDNHLLALMQSATPSLSEFEKMGIRYRAADAVNTLFRQDWPLRSIMNFAEAHGVILGSAVAYVWAAAFLERPTSVFLRSEATRWSASRTGKRWSVLRDSPLSQIAVLGATSHASRLLFLNEKLLASEAVATAHAATPIGDLVPHVPAERISAVRKRLAYTSDNFARDRWYDDFQGIHKDTWEAVCRTISGNESASKHVKTTVDFARDGLSGAALIAASTDNDGIAPFYADSVPYISVLAAAVESRVPASDVTEALVRAGYQAPIPPDAGMLEKIATEHQFLWFGKGASAMTNPLEYLNHLPAVVDLGRTVGWERLADAIIDVANSSLTEGRLRHLGELNFGDPILLQRQAKAFSREFTFWDINVASLVICADRCELTYGEALEALLPYRNVARSWQLPDTLAPDLAGMAPIQGLYQMFEASTEIVMDAAKWALLGMRASAVTGRPMAELATSAGPLLASLGRDTSVLFELARLVPGRVHFDHLVIAGCLQMLPGGTSKAELEAMARPFANDPSSLAAKAEVMAQMPEMKWLEHDSSPGRD
ncbi:caspase family protein [Actinoplanes sp. NPDC026619]|uniref:caspase family protein n=1 Tax=Actinoplanes sp. NPDC026619 TaxID=3155798 RepID=UPI0033E9EAD4